MTRALAVMLVALAACGGREAVHTADARSAPPAVLELALGEAVELDVDAKGTTSARIAPASADVVVIVGSTRFDGSRASFPYRVRLEATATSRSRKLDACSMSPDHFRDAASRSPERGGPPASGPAPSVGARRPFTFRAGKSRETVAARAIAVGSTSVVWADETPEHPALLDEAFVKDFLNDFENVILPRARTVFGHESDIDRDGRIALLFTPRTYESAVAFFSGCDLAPRAICPGSNEGEILYLTPPNAIRPPYNTPRAMKEILSHEIEHLIHHRAKVLDHGGHEDPESAYLLEGFGALAQDALGFQAGNLYVTMAGLEQVDELSLGDVLAEGGDYDKRRDGALRGGAYLFVRWLYDRAGGDRVQPSGAVEDLGGPTLVHRLLGAPGSVASVLPRETGASTAALAMDFFTALVGSGRGEGGAARAANPCFTYLPTAVDPVTGRQRGADTFASFHGMSMHGPAIQDAAHADGVLRAGGVEYLGLGHAGAFTIEANPSSLPRVRVLRIR